MDARNADRRPIKGWEGFYELTAAGDVWSVREERFILWARDDHDRPYIEVQIGGVRYERGIVQAVEEVWGDTSLVAHLPRWVPNLDRGAVKLFDHVIGVYHPPMFWRRERPWKDDIGKRGLFQAAGVVSLEDDRRIRQAIGETVCKPRDLPGWPQFSFTRIPLSWLVELERAPKEITQYRPSTTSGVQGKGRR